MEMYHNDVESDEYIYIVFVINVCILNLAYNYCRDTRHITIIVS